MIVGSYSLHLYCDAASWTAPPHGFQEFPHEFTGETYGECAREARRRGWRLGREGRAVCPKCNRTHKGKPTAADVPVRGEEG